MRKMINVAEKKNEEKKSNVFRTTNARTISLKSTSIKSGKSTEKNVFICGAKIENHARSKKKFLFDQDN